MQSGKKSLYTSRLKLPHNWGAGSSTKEWHAQKQASLFIYMLLYSYRGDRKQTHKEPKYLQKSKRMFCPLIFTFSHSLQKSLHRLLSFFLCWHRLSCLNCRNTCFIDSNIFFPPKIWCSLIFLCMSDRITFGLVSTATGHISVTSTV
jgi:hypothetical protein